MFHYLAQSQIGMNAATCPAQTSTSLHAQTFPNQPSMHPFAPAFSETPDKNLNFQTQFSPPVNAGMFDLTQQTTQTNIPPPPTYESAMQNSPIVMQPQSILQPIPESQNGVSNDPLAQLQAGLAHLAGEANILRFEQNELLKDIQHQLTEVDTPTLARAQLERQHKELIVIMGMLVEAGFSFPSEVNTQNKNNFNVVAT